MPDQHPDALLHTQRQTTLPRCNRSRGGIAIQTSLRAGALSIKQKVVENPVGG